VKGRGLVIAAAVLQLCGAGLGLLACLSLVWIPERGLHVIAAFDGIVGAGMIPVSIFLLYGKRWAWWASLVVSGLASLAMLAMPIGAAVSHRAFGIGFGELIIVMFVGVPVFANVGLLIGGRHAVFRAR
jgi:hypothetical protein